jgi:nucleotide-binding universal stress UspA family protein
MEKKLLIAIDNSRHSENAVRYTAGFFDNPGEVKVALFHVLPALSQYLLVEARKNPKAGAELNKLAARNSQAAQEFMQTYKERLTRLGFVDENVQLVALPRMFGVAKDILEYGLARRFDAVVMGRRGLSSLQEVFVGSVSANTVNNSSVTPIWLVDETGPSKDVLVAVDGSESSMKAVDHLAFILQGDADTHLSFLHVTPRLGDVCPVDFQETVAETLEEVIRQGNRQCIDRFFSHALKRLGESGIRENRIAVKVVEGALRVGKSVLDEFRNGGFGTLVIGRRGMGKKFFTGSVSRYLIDQFSDGALWVVP